MSAGRRVKIDRWSGVFWFWVGAFISFESVHLDLGSPRTPGSGFIPFLLGSLLEVLGIILFIWSFYIESQEEDSGGRILGSNWKGKGIVLAGLMVYVVVFSFLGYVISTFLLLSFLLNMSHRKGWALRLVAAAVFVLLSYLTFGSWLGCPLPAGIFGVRW
jgi:hypothetical protein